MNDLMKALKPLLADLGSTLVFVLVSAITRNPLLASGAAMAFVAAQVAWQKSRGQPIPALQWMSLGLVAVFGSATLLTHNAIFMMVKPSIIYAIVGGVMLQRGWMLRYLPDDARELVGDLMVRWGYVWSGLMFVSAALNLALAFLATPAVWGGFTAVFLPVSKIALFAIQYASMRMIGTKRHAAAAAQVAPQPIEAAA